MCDKDTCNDASCCGECEPWNCLEQQVNDILATKEEHLQGYVDEAKDAAAESKASAEASAQSAAESKEFRDEAETAASTAVAAEGVVLGVANTLQGTADKLEQVADELNTAIAGIAVSSWFYTTVSENQTVIIVPESKNAVDVQSIYIEGARQSPSRGFEFDKATMTITLSEPLPLGLEIEIILGTYNSDNPNDFAQTLASPNGANLIGFEDTTVGAILKQDIVVIGITGQSNAVGSRTGGPNPANPKVVVWDGSAGSWGSSDYTKAPFSTAAPNGNGGNNNVALAFAHRLVDEHKAKKVYIIYDALGGRPISDWVGSGTDSVRYAAFKAKVAAALNSPELVGESKTALDYLIWFQGEEDALTDTVSVYRDKFTILDKQLRAESWMNDTTPMFVMGMSGLHTRYFVWQAQINYCENKNRNCIYVNSAGLKTQYDIDATGDYTHFLGDSLWEHGYYRIWQAMHERGVTHRNQLTPFYARGTGPWNGETDAVALFSSLVSIDSTTNKFPVNAVAATGSITWGLNCAADGNYTMAGGHTVVTNNTCNYSMGWGREITFGAACAYSASFGYRNNLNQWGQIALGIGHTLSSTYEFAAGRYTRYVDEQTNKVIYQLGIGLANSRKNAITVRDDGAVETLITSTHDPVQNGEMVINLKSNTELVIKVRGTDGVLRVASLTLAEPTVTP